MLKTFYRKCAKRCQAIELQAFGISSSLLKLKKKKIIDINMDYDGRYAKIQIITKTTIISNSNNSYEGCRFQLVQLVKSLMVV